MFDPEIVGQDAGIERISIFKYMIVYSSADRAMARHGAHVDVLRHQHDKDDPDARLQRAPPLESDLSALPGGRQPSGSALTLGACLEKQAAAIACCPGFRYALIDIAFIYITVSERNLTRITRNLGHAFLVIV